MQVRSDISKTVERCLSKRVNFANDIFQFWHNKVAVILRTEANTKLSQIYQTLIYLVRF